MAASDYEELETLFHTDLQSLDLQNEDSEEAAAAHLPEWLIGVIVVVILLIIAFFAMVIYSLMKERKKSRAGSYGGTTTSASICEDVEVGKSDGAIRITAFSLEQDKDSGVGNGHSKNGSSGTGWTLDSEAAATLQRREPGVSGCMNPAFIDDDDDDEDNADKDNSKCESARGQGVGKDQGF
ncbi:uncharacterized protein LOC112573653 [Pomacea canaliculata]|uniref:uncharacterized protein LOC112573653 n=1 Tax=Pomacea canaliculata TaxID=400727 RepID=UPI000D73E4C7|nr:uncharacterized protein LOC112573653 [Pomacea canaliculata]